MRQGHDAIACDCISFLFLVLFYFILFSRNKGGSMTAGCRCGCGKHVSLRGVPTKLCSGDGFSSIDLNKMTKEQPRRLPDPDGLKHKHQTTPREMKLTDSKKRINDQPPGRHRSSSGQVFCGTPRRLKYQQPKQQPDRFCQWKAGAIRQSDS